MTSCVKNFKGCSPEDRVDFSAELGYGEQSRGGIFRFLEEKAFPIIKVIYGRGDSVSGSHRLRGGLGGVCALTWER